MRLFVLMLILSVGCTDQLPNEPFDAAGTGQHEAGAQPPGRGTLGPSRLTFDGTFGADGRATVVIADLTPQRLPVLMGWQQSTAGVWSNDVVALVSATGAVELRGTPSVAFQLVMLP